MFQEEAVALLQKHEGTLLWQEGLLQLFHYIEENKAVCLCALNSVGRDHLKRFFEEEGLYCPDGFPTPEWDESWQQEAMVELGIS